MKVYSKTIADNSSFDCDTGITYGTVETEYGHIDHMRRVVESEGVCEISITVFDKGSYVASDIWVWDYGMLANVDSVIADRITRLAVEQYERVSAKEEQ